MLKRIEINKFKSVANFDESLPPVTVLVGTNNSGKTSVLNAVHSAVAMAQSRLRLAGQTAINSDGVNFSIGPADTLYLPLVETSWLAPNGALTQTNGPSIKFHFDDPGESKGHIEILKGRNRNLVVQLSGREVIGRIEKIEEPFSIYVPGLAGIARNESFIAKGALLRAVARGDANLVLRNVLYLLSQDAAKWRLFVSALREVFPGHYIVVRFKPDTDENIAVTVARDEREIPLDCIGTGFLQTTQILSYIFLFNPAVTLLDEPDSHLHPNNQRLLAELLWKLASEKHTRVIMATHSRHILDALREKDDVGIKWMRLGRVQRIEKHVALLAELGALDNAEGLIALGVEFVVLTEDKDKQLLKILLEANGAPYGKFQIWAYKGCSRLEIAEALGKFIAEVSPQTKILVHRDSDFMSDDDKTFLKQEFDRYQMDLFLPPTPDMEGCLCRIDHLVELNPANIPAVRAAWAQALAADVLLLRQAARKGRKNMDDIRHKQGRPTEGVAVIDAWAAGLDLNLERWRHGKVFLAKIRAHFQAAVGANLQTDRRTQHLIVPPLQAWIAAARPGPAQVAPIAPAALAPGGP